MKIGTENRTKTIIAVALLIVAAFMVYQWISSSGGETAASSNSATPPVNPAPSPTASAKTARKGQLVAQTLDPTLRFDLLKSSEGVTYKGSGRDIFRSQAEPPPIPKPVKPDVQPAKAYTPPPPPPINLKFYGFASSKDGNKRIFLSQGEDIFVAKEGQVIDRRYRIVKINASSVEVEDVLTNNHQTLPLSAG